MLALWTLTSATSAAPQQALNEAPFRAEIAEARLVDVDTRSASAEIVVSVSSNRHIRIRSFRFRRVAVNGMPAYLDPVFETVEISAGERVLLPAFRATLRFRDLSSLDPVRKLFEQARVRVAGAARAEVELDWLQRLATGSRHASVWHAFDQELQIEIPGGRLRELSAKTLFALAEPVAQAGWELQRKAAKWLDDDWEPAAAQAAAIRTSYGYRGQDGTPNRTETLAAGVVLTPQIVVTPLEAVEPWRFDPVMALALQRGEAQLSPHRELEALLPTGSSGERKRYRLSRAELEVQADPCETERVLVADEQGKTRRVTVCRAGGQASLAVLRIVPEGASTLAPWRRIRPAPGETLHMTVVRLVPGRGGGQAHWELLRLQGRVEGDEIRLAEPVDPAALGSPLLLDGIPIGVVQHERGGLLLAEWGRPRPAR